MEIRKVSRSRKSGVWVYLVSLRPEPFALSIYTLIMSILAANWLWMEVLFLCATVELSDVQEVVQELLSIHFLFAVATTFLWWQLLQERGRSVVTHVTFFVWQGSKFFSACLEVCAFNIFYRRLVYHTPKEVYGDLCQQMCLGVLLITVVEVYGLVLATRYLRQRNSRRPDTELAYSAAVVGV